MNPNKPVKPMNDILTRASSCTNIYNPVVNSVKKLSDLRATSYNLRCAYDTLRTIRTQLLRDNANCQKIFNKVNAKGELSHALHYDIPVITNENKKQVVVDVVACIDNAMLELSRRMKNSAVAVSTESINLIDMLNTLAVDQKSILCDLRQYVSAVDYTEQEKMNSTNICGYSKENFSLRVSALKNLYRALNSKWEEWSTNALSSSLNRLGYKLKIETGEDLEPECLPEDPLEPEISVGPTAGVQEGSDSPIPDADKDPSQVTPSVESMRSDTLQNLGWSRKTMLDCINSLIAAIDKVKELDSLKANLTAVMNEVDSIPEDATEYHHNDRIVIKDRNYSDMCSNLLTIYGREVNHLTNDVIGMVVHLHGYLGTQS